MVTNLEPDILEGELKWALGSITVNKARGGDGISAELFQILKDDTTMPQKCHKLQYVSIYGKLSRVHRIEKVSFHPNLKEGQFQRMFKLLCNWAHFPC